MQALNCGGHAVGGKAGGKCPGSGCGDRCGLLGLRFGQLGPKGSKFCGLSSELGAERSSLFLSIRNGILICAAGKDGSAEAVRLGGIHGHDQGNGAVGVVGHGRIQRAGGMDHDVPQCGQQRMVEEGNERKIIGTETGNGCFALVCGESGTVKAGMAAVSWKVFRKRSVT